VWRCLGNTGLSRRSVVVAWCKTPGGRGRARLAAMSFLDFSPSRISTSLFLRMNLVAVSLFVMLAASSIPLDLQYLWCHRHWPAENIRITRTLNSLIPRTIQTSSSYPLLPPIWSLGRSRRMPTRPMPSSRRSLITRFGQTPEEEASKWQ
jgi:hypothetical protein